MTESARLCNEAGPGRVAASAGSGGAGRGSAETFDDGDVGLTATLTHRL